MSNYNDSNHSGSNPEDGGLKSSGAAAGKQSVRATGVDGSQANWLWMQERCSQLTSAAPFGAWLDCQLVDLEADYADLITARSRSRDLRKQLSRERE
jgi:hypothetical protein